jgi:SAM-dependent methyltransferase
MSRDGSRGDAGTGRTPARPPTPPRPERLVVPTGNSKTPIAFDPDWIVLDVGSGHAPHPRATVLVERFLDSNHERAGRAARLPSTAPVVIADAQALPFRDGSIDFAIYSHVAEHVEDPAALCSEARRVARAGYLESPSPFSELLRHPRNHRWRVRAVRSGLVFRRIGPSSPLGRVGDAIYGLYFYKGPQLVQQDVPRWSHGVRRRTLDRALALVGRALRWSWRRARPLTYTRFRWHPDSELRVFVVGGGDRAL